MRNSKKRENVKDTSKMERNRNEKLKQKSQKRLIVREEILTRLSSRIKIE